MKVQFTDERSSAAEARCILLAPDRDFGLFAGENVIGRSDACAVVVHASGVSRQHARLTVSDESMVLEDLQSKNGTFVNGKRIAQKIALHDGDEIRLGAALLTFRVGVPTTTTTTAVRILG